MVAQKMFNYKFAATMENVLWLQQNGYNRDQIIPIVGMDKGRISRAMRIYLASLGKTADSTRIEVKNKAIELVKLLEADEISLNRADVELVEAIKKYNGRTISRAARSPVNPEKQLEGYSRAIGNLEGICYALETLPEMVHSSITAEQRLEIEQRLAACRRIIERRINIIRKDNNAEAYN